jgi:ADP-ribosyltransferase exoenzyme
MLDYNDSTSKKYLSKSAVAFAKKGAYSTTKVKANEVSKNIIQKLSASSKAIENSSKHKKEVQIKEYCETKDFSKLEEPFISHSEWAFIPIKILKYNTPYDLDKEPVFVQVVPYDMFGSSWRIYKEYNNYNEDFLKTSSISNELMMDTQWLLKQKDYIYNLPKYDIFTLKGYTHYGDVLVNSLLRNVLDYDLLTNRNKDYFDSMFYFPLFFQLDRLVSSLISKDNKHDVEALFAVPGKTKVNMYSSTSKTIPHSGKLQNYIDLIKRNYESLLLSDRYILLISLWNYMHSDIYKIVIMKFYEDLTRIIENSPSLTKDIKVYRGVRDDYYLRGSKDGIYKNIGFISTSLDVEKAQLFQNLDNNNNSRKDGCCIKVITLLKGTKAILMMPISTYGDEKEVLLNHGSVYSIKTPKVLKTFYNAPSSKTTDICQRKTYKVYVSELIVTN